MDRLELRHIRVVVAIARAGSIRAAAAALRIAQPALVGQLQRIERAAGGPLFTRTRTGVAPTERGAKLVDEGAALVDDFDRLIDDTTARAAESERATALRVGAMRALDSPTLIAALRELRPAEIEARQLDSLSEGLGLLGRASWTPRCCTGSPCRCRGDCGTGTWWRSSPRSSGSPPTTRWPPARRSTSPSWPRRTG